MNKYGVDTGDDEPAAETPRRPGEKQAAVSASRVCTICGTKIAGYAGSLPICPVHGTAPWERPSR